MYYVLSSNTNLMKPKTTPKTNAITHWLDFLNLQKAYLKGLT